MKRITTLFVAASLLFAASTCFAQMYTVTDLGTLGGSSSLAYGINNLGQVVGISSVGGDTAARAFRTAPNSRINPATDDLGTLDGQPSFLVESSAHGINDSGQVVGFSTILFGPNGYTYHAFRTAPNSRINPATDDLGGLSIIHYGPPYGDQYESHAVGINASGQVVGHSWTTWASNEHAFRTAPNSPINPAADDLGTLGGGFSEAFAINNSGQVVGSSATLNGFEHGFRTAPNSPINPATDDLGTLGGGRTMPNSINASGQVVGYSNLPGDTTIHAFRTAPNSPINPATDDLGTLGGTTSAAWAIDDYGQVLGGSTLPGDVVAHIFLYSNGAMHDLSNLLALGSGCESIGGTLYLNNRGQIAGYGNCGGQTHSVLLNPIFNAFVRQPINADGSSVFSPRRGAVPVKFTLTQYDVPTCTLSPATIAVTRTAGGTLGAIDENAYSMAADSGSNFRIDGCQYVYNLAASSLGVGTYRVDISLNGIMVGHAVFALK